MRAIQGIYQKQLLSTMITIGGDHDALFGRVYGEWATVALREDGNVFGTLHAARRSQMNDH